MSLINREALLSYADLRASCGEHYTAEDVIMMIKTAPTVDAVPVVRCWECVNCLIDNTERKYHICMRHNSIFPRKVDLMDFCSYGEKEGAD